MSEIALLTPTGGRPEAWKLCEKWMRNQRFQDFTWFIVDDCEPRQEYTWPEKQQVLYSDKIWHVGDKPSQIRNIQILLNTIKEKGKGFRACFMIEDDEWYSPEYLSTLVGLVREYAVVGEGLARYYSLKTRSWHRHPNTQWACLCRTAFRRNMLDMFEGCLVFDDWSKQQPLDRVFWKQCRKVAGLGYVYTDKGLSVGIKGMPGRYGIGGGHDGHPRYAKDDAGVVLSGWLGKDAVDYAPYLVGAING